VVRYDDADDAQSFQQYDEFPADDDELDFNSIHETELVVPKSTKGNSMIIFTFFFIFFS
jgi:hypothetical protein